MQPFSLAALPPAVSYPSHPAVSTAELRMAARLADARAALSVAEAALDALTVRVARGASHLVSGRDDLVTVRAAVGEVFAARAAYDDLRFELLGAEETWAAMGRRGQATPNDESDVESALIDRARANAAPGFDFVSHDAATYRAAVGY